MEKINIFKVIISTIKATVKEYIKLILNKLIDSMIIIKYKFNFLRSFVDLN